MLLNQTANRSVNRSSGKSSSGFTTVELVVVLVLIGILVSYAVPRFSGRGGYSELTVQHDLKQSIRFAQQLAMTRTGTPITFVINANQLDVRENNVSILGNYPKTLPTDVPLNNLVLAFDRFGSAGAAKTTINIVGTVQTLKICVEAITGYAHEC